MVFSVISPINLIGGLWLTKRILKKDNFIWLDVELMTKIFSDWKCQTCSETVNSITMRTFLETCQEEVNNFNEAKIELVEEKINSWSKVLHKNHFLIGMLRKRLFDLYGLYPAPEEEVELKPFLQVIMYNQKL